MSGMGKSRRASVTHKVRGSPARRPLSVSDDQTAWPDATTVHDMIEHFPLPIALLDDAGAR